MERFIARKEAASACGVHPKTIEEWERVGAFRTVRQNGSRGKVRIGADAEGIPVFNEGWSREGRTEPGRSDLPEVRKIDPELVRVSVREIGAYLSTLPPIPDPATEALARGEPESVVAARVEARGRVLQALIWVGGMAVLLFTALGVFAMTTGRRLRFRA